MDEVTNDSRLSPMSAAVALGLRATGMPRFRTRLALKACRDGEVARCPVEALTNLPDGVRNLVPGLCSICSSTNQSYRDMELLEIGRQGTQEGRSLKCIFLEVYGGLCNRLRALVSGICWAEDTSSRLVVCWPYDNMVCYCRFDDLFDATSLPSFVTVTPCRLGPALSSRSEAEMEKQVAAAVGNGQSVLRLRTCECFYESDHERWLRHLRALRPTQEILARISEVLARAPGPRIGVLVRLHGHATSTEESPLSAFIEPMRAENPAAVFVVATDDDEAEVYLENEFPGRCLFPARFRERDYHRSREGMKEVLVNFICLARCPRILASYWSSFGYVAADYGGSELVEIRRRPIPGRKHVEPRCAEPRVELPGRQTGTGMQAAQTAVGEAGARQQLEASRATPGDRGEA